MQPVSSITNTPRIERYAEHRWAIAELFHVSNPMSIVQSAGRDTEAAAHTRLVKK